jgi:hypothetical protein
MIKARVLADIRNLKGEKDKQDKQKDRDKNSANRIRQATKEEIEAMKDEQLEESMKLFILWEGEKGFESSETTPEIEKRLMTTNPRLYYEAVSSALMDRINEYGISMNEVDEEVKKVIQGEITDVDKVKEIKERAIKEIGVKGAKSKWSSLMSKAKKLLEKAKKGVTEQVKKDLKKIKDQMKSLKSRSSGDNSYLTDFYQKDKANIEKLERDLSSYSNENQTDSPKEIPWGIIIPVSLVVVVLIGVVAVVVRKRKQNRVKRIIE